MKNSGVKGALGALAVVAVAFAAKKMIDRKRFMKGIFEEYGKKSRSPFDVADTSREMDDEKYAELKNKLKEKFSSRCCENSKCCASEA